MPLKFECVKCGRKVTTMDNSLPKNWRALPLAEAYLVQICPKCFDVLERLKAADPFAISAELTRLRVVNMRKDVFPEDVPPF